MMQQITLHPTGYQIKAKRPRRILVMARYGSREQKLAICPSQRVAHQWLAAYLKGDLDVKPTTNE